MAGRGFCHYLCMLPYLQIWFGNDLGWGLCALLRKYLAWFTQTLASKFQWISLSSSSRDWIQGDIALKKTTQPTINTASHYQKFSWRNCERTVSWNLKGSSRYQPFKAPLCRLNVPYAACGDDLDRWYYVWCWRGHHWLQATAALSMEPATAQRRLAVASATVYPRRIGSTATSRRARDTLRPTALRAPMLLSVLLLWQPLSQQQRPS